MYTIYLRRDAVNVSKWEFRQHFDFLITLDYRHNKLLWRVSDQCSTSHFLNLVLNTQTENGAWHHHIIGHRINEERQDLTYCICDLPSAGNTTGIQAAFMCVGMGPGFTSVWIITYTRNLFGQISSANMLYISNSLEQSDGFLVTYVLYTS
jgi:hypothetical protein